MNYDKIIVIDFGSQTNRLITRRIRDQGVYSELYPHTIKAADIEALKNVKGIILSGGPNSVYDDNALRVDPSLFSLDIPILGICYGMQLIVHHYGGTIEKTPSREYGSAKITLQKQSRLLAGLEENETVWMSHGDHTTALPDGFKRIAYSPSCDIAAIENDHSNLYGVQFHPEVQHTQKGHTILKNFIFDICGAHASWTMENYIDTQVSHIREKTEGKNVILGLSGGVDSSVTAMIIDKAIGNRLTCIFVDHGLLREGEADQVMEAFANHMKLNILKVDAQKRFLFALKGTVDPEKKRKIIGKTFIQVFEEAAEAIDDVAFLAQGTLYTDVIESGSDTAKTIKSHHNVGGLPKIMKLDLIEPLNKLFKDEVRTLGKSLGMPETMIERQPFPGPGLAIRIIGEVTEKKLEIVRKSDKILHEVFASNGLDKTVWQYFTVLTPLKTVGVMGDKRTYEHVLAVRAITSLDGMSADWARIPHNVLETLSNRIINEVHGINRVVYDITSKPPGTIEWE